MLELRPIRPIFNDLPRRWMADDYFDLIVWYELDYSLHGFQLCYDKPFGVHALNWTTPHGFHHLRIDTGEDHAYASSAPHRRTRRTPLPRGQSSPGNSTIVPKPCRLSCAP